MYIWILCLKENSFRFLPGHNVSASATPRLFRQVIEPTDLRLEVTSHQSQTSASLG